MTPKPSARVRSMMRMTMADMADLADARPGTFRLENADSYLIPPEHVLAATRDALGDDDHNSYLPLRGLRTMRHAVAQRLREDFGLEYDPEGEIVVSSGAGESLLNALLVLIEPGDRVLLTNPTYSGMAQRVRLAGGEQVFTNLLEVGGRWSLDPEDVRTRAEGCRAIFVASPCMPTGTVFDADETQALADAALEHDLPVIFNGACDKVIFDGRRLVHPAALPGMQDRTVVVGCVSKNYGMPGWRIGWAAAPRVLAGALENTHIFNGIMPSGFCQAGATAALSEPQDWQGQLVETFQRNRDVLLSELAAAPGIRPVAPEGGYFFIADIEQLGIDADTFCERLLAEHAVAVTPMRGWGSDDFGRYTVRFIFTDEPEERLCEAGRRVAAFASNRTSLTSSI
jgi:N-succinyldiaminopimelate aminotransferase